MAECIRNDTVHVLSGYEWRESACAEILRRSIYCNCSF